ncbi:MAG: AAA family ATPase [Halobacteriales archaeon]
MTVFATVGYPASGKGEVATVARDVGVPVVTMGDFVRRACRARGLPITEANQGRVASALRDRDGPDAIAQACLPLVRAAHGAYETVLIDGIRNRSEVERFRAALGDEFHLIAVAAPFEVRLERVRARGRDETAEDAADLRERDRRERGYGMDEAIARADHRIDNAGTLEDFYRRVEELLAGAGRV